MVDKTAADLEQDARLTTLQRQLSALDITALVQQIDALRHEQERLDARITRLEPLLEFADTIRRWHEFFSRR